MNTPETRLAVEVGVSIKSERVRQVLQKICLEKGFPEMLRSDNGNEERPHSSLEYLTPMEFKSKMENNKKLAIAVG